MECLSSRRERAPWGGGRAKIENSSRPHPWKFGVKRFLVLREALARKWGGLFLSYLLGKNYRRRDRDHLVPPRGWMQQSTVPRCAILSVGSTGVTSSEAARVHYACRRRGSSVAAGGTRAAGGDAGDRISQRHVRWRTTPLVDRVSAGPQ